MKTSNYSDSKEFSDKFEDTELDIHGVRLPEFEIDLSSKRQLGISEDSSNYDFLRALALNGFKTLNINKTDKDYKKYVDRAKHELDTLKELGFIDYILLVWDVIHFCKTSDIPVGLGRGSAAGSLILYLVGVTRIDPVKYDLYFERFISKIRAKKQVIDGVTYLDGSLMCDVDLDICYYNRQKVLQYLENKFKGKTSKILTFNSLSGKLLIKECGKIIAEKPEQEMTMISSLIPKTYGQVKDISEDKKDPYIKIPEIIDDAEWLIFMYHNILKMKNIDRKDSGHQYWMSEFNKGAKRPDIENYFRDIALKENEKNKQIKFEDLLDSNDKGRVIYVIPESAGDIFLSTVYLNQIKDSYQANVYIFPPNPQIKNILIEIQNFLD